MRFYSEVNGRITASGWKANYSTICKTGRTCIGKRQRNYHGSWGTVYVLVNFDTTMAENLFRIYKLQKMGFDPYVMIYDKPNAPREIRLLQRWCNNKQIFKSCPRFEDYDPRRG